MAKDEVELGVYFKGLLRRWKLVGFVTLLCGAAGLGYTVKATPTWQAKASLLLSTTDTNAESALAALAGQQGATPLNIIEGVVKSRTAIELISKKTGLTPKSVKANLMVEGDTKDNQLVLSATSKKQEVALGLVQAGMDSLNDISRTLGFSQADRQARMLESTLAEKQRELEDSESKLAEFVKNMKAPSDPSDATSIANYGKSAQALAFELNAVNKQLDVAKKMANKSAVGAITMPTNLGDADQWRNKLDQLQYELRIKEQTYGPNATDVVRLKRDIQVTEDQLRRTIAKRLESINKNLDPNMVDLEAKRALLEHELKYATKIANVAPEEAKQMSKLFREVSTDSAVVNTLRQQYEAAKVAAEVEKVRWGVLEKPYIEDEPTNKHYGRMTAISLIFGLFLSALLCSYLDNKDSKRRARMDSMAADLGTLERPHQERAPLA